MRTNRAAAATPAITSAEFLAQTRRLIAADEALAAEALERVRRHRKLVKALEKMHPPAPAKALRVVPGSVEDRVLKSCREPQKLAAIVAAAGARAADVQVAVKALVRAGRLTQTGASSATRYTAKS